MRITVVGAGAMGGSYGGLLALAGHEVQLIDAWQAHVDAINRDGLLIDGRARRAAGAPPGRDRARLGRCGRGRDPVRRRQQHATPPRRPWRRSLAPDGCAITFQNGIGNVETLQAALGRERVLGGSSMCSAATRGPGHVCLTHLGRTSLGETDGALRPRTERLAAALNGAGFETEVVPDVMAVIWEKFALNCCINAIAATTGLRAGEIARLPELDAFQDKIIAEVMAVTAAKGIRLPTPDLPAKIKAQCRKKFNQPSMLQHVEAGRRTEIDALNGALLREAAAQGVATPYNEALVALLKGRELHQQRVTHEPDLDFDAWEARVARGEA